MSLPPIHLSIMQPEGYVHSLGFLDQARYFRHMFRRQGAQVTVGKNRLRENAVNFVFGAHLGFPADWQARHACVFVNLEQLGQGGAAVSSDYLKLLSRSAVVDYDAANVPTYAQDPEDVPTVSFGYAAYLDQPCLALEERPIDLLFFGSMNARRQRFIAEVEAAGFNVAAFDSPIYGPERDEFIRRSKAVLNCHFYESNRFEQARAFHCLSLGTPVISECTPTTAPASAFVDSVLWLPEQVKEWFSLHFDTPAFYEEARKCLDTFRTPDAAHDPLKQYADLLDFASGFQQGFGRVRVQGAWQPRAIHLGSGRDYKPTWLNINPTSQDEPDLVLDMAQPLALPCELVSQSGTNIRLEAGSVELVFADSVLGRPADLPTTMRNILELLQIGASCAIEQPSTAARQDWHEFTDGFWRLGWFEHRFELAPLQWLDDTHAPATPERATRIRTVLRKLVTTPRERTLARTMQADFGMADDTCNAATTVGAASLSITPQTASAPAPAAVAPRHTAPTSVMASVTAATAAASADLAAATMAATPHPAGLPSSLVALLLDA